MKDAPFTHEIEELLVDQEEIHPNESLTLILKDFRLSGSINLEQKYPNIDFKECLYTMGTVVGWIAGLWLSGKKEEANYYADNFIKNLTQLNLALEEKEWNGRNYPSKVCKLFPDGTALGFSFGWYVFGNQAEPYEPSRCIRFPYNNSSYPIYKFWMSGGLLFHGLGEVYAVTLDSKPGWSIHT